jgi:hypothetical protein
VVEESNLLGYFYLRLIGSNAVFFADRALLLCIYKREEESNLSLLFQVFRRKLEVGGSIPPSGFQARLAQLVERKPPIYNSNVFVRKHLTFIYNTFIYNRVFVPESKIFIRKLIF